MYEEQQRSQSGVPYVFGALFIIFAAVLARTMQLDTGGTIIIVVIVACLFGVFMAIETYGRPKIHIHKNHLTLISYKRRKFWDWWKPSAPNVLELPFKSIAKVEVMDPQPLRNNVRVNNNYIHNPAKPFVLITAKDGEKFFVGSDNAKALAARIKQGGSQ